MKRYWLPVEWREELRKLHGELDAGDGIETTKEIIKNLNEYPRLITVGDIVTYNLLNAGLVPDISFVDDRTKRSPASDMVMKGTRHSYFRNITVENPPGIITEELLNETQKAMESNTPVQIFIKGEEDLAALALFTVLEYGSVVAYGLPDANGTCAVTVTPEIRRAALSLKGWKIKPE